MTTLFIVVKVIEISKEMTSLDDVFYYKVNTNKYLIMISGQWKLYKMKWTLEGWCYKHNQLKSTMYVQRYVTSGLGSPDKKLHTKIFSLILSVSYWKRL